MKKTPLKRSSKQRMPLYRQYAKIRKQYLEDHPTCAVCDRNVATQIHHKRSRMGTLLINTHYFLAVCLMCHEKITNNPKWAMDRGYSLDRLTHD